MSAVVLSSDVRDGVRHVSLNRPEKRNALNRELITALSEQLRQAADDDATRVVLIRVQGSFQMRSRSSGWVRFNEKEERYSGESP